MVARPMAPEGRETVLWLLLFATALAWPVLTAAYPLGQDAPNHLARVFILLNADDPAFTEHFAVAWRAVPNLAWDLFAVFAGRWLPLVLVLKLFLLISALANLGGILALSRAANARFVWPALLPIVFLYHAGNSMAFFNFSLGLGVMLLAVAWWVAAARRPWLVRLLIASLLSTLLFFIHLAAWGIYGLFVLGCELRPVWRAAQRHGWSGAIRPLARLLRDGLQALPPVLIVALSATSRGHEIALSGQVTEFHWPWTRLREVWRFLDIGTPVPSAVFLTLSGLAILWLIRNRTVRLDRRFWWPLGVLLIAFFVVPNQIYGTHLVGWRPGIGGVLILLAVLGMRQPVMARNVRIGLAVLLATTFGLSIWQAVGFANAQDERQYLHAVAAPIAPGDLVLALHAGDDNLAIEFDRIGLYHFGAELVMTRRVVPQNLFATATQQPITYKQPDIHQSVFLHSLIEDLAKKSRTLAGYTQEFDWIVIHWIGPPGATMPAFPGFAEIDRRGRFILYRKSG